MKTLLSIVGLAVLAIVGTLGIAAWILLPSRMHVTFETGDAETAREPEPMATAPASADDLAALRGETQRSLETLRQGMDGLSKAIGSSLDGIAKEASRNASRSDDRVAAITQRLDALSGRMDALARDLSALRAETDLRPNGEKGEQEAAPQEDTETPPKTGRADDPGTALAPPATEEPPPQTEGQRAAVSFADLFARKERVEPPGPREYTLLEGGCRVGFDGTSTIHSFTGVTGKVQGSLRFLDDDPASQASATISVDARTLTTDDDGRDEEMHGTYLETQTYPTIRFTLEGVRDVETTPEGFRAVATGSIEAHGKTTTVTAPVTIERKGSRGVVVRAEWPMTLSSLGIAIPKAVGGLITMKDEVKAWCVLQAQAESP